MTTITPAERAAALANQAVMTDGDEGDLYRRDPQSWAERAQHVWRVLMVKSDKVRREELLAIATPPLRDLLNGWLAEYERLYRDDRKAWAAFAAPAWRIVLSCSDPAPKRGYWQRMDPELKAALKALADSEKPELENAA